MVVNSSILAWEIPWTEKLAGNSPWGHKESGMTEIFIFALEQGAPEES